jgi:hypothetical protein
LGGLHGDLRVTLFIEALERMPPRAARGDTARAREHYQRFVDYWAGGEIDRERVESADDWLGVHD